ncbi:hypothetical protein [Streptomyces sp. NPDC048266]|uniref:hypothetical protein n=1 Tax=Streptomyces sp. NPDC048266 TaxID=3155787 RepID=UPI0033E82CF8
MQRADLVVRAPDAGVPVLLEIDSRSQDAHDLIVKLRRCCEGDGCSRRTRPSSREYHQSEPVVVTILEQLTEHGVGAAVRRRLGQTGEQTLTDALHNSDGHALYRAQEARADAEDERRRAAEREARRPVRKRCGRKFTDERWEEVTVHRTAVRAGDKSVCGPCRADDVAREEAARLEAGAPPEPQGGPEPDRGGRGLLRRRS